MSQPTVGIQMLGQIRLEREPFAAERARMRLLARVGLDVGAQVALVRKPFVTNVAGERFLAGVGAHVALQQPGSRKGFAAHPANTCGGCGSGRQCGGGLCG